MPSKDNFHHNDQTLHRNTLILDHNDSYTFNLFQLCHSVSKGTVVVVNYKR
jgi:anthranilate/para-aminobenzoate synthase component II